MPTIRWNGPPPAADVLPETWEQTLEDYFGQDPHALSVELTVVSGGRSGALTLFARVTADRGGTPVTLQPEFVKISLVPQVGRTEAEVFEEFVAGTTLVHGHSLIRPRLRNASGTIEVYSYALYEAQEHLVPLWVSALYDERRTRAAVADVVGRLLSWYGSPPATAAPDLAGEHYLVLVERVRGFDPALADSLAATLGAVLDGSRVGATTRVHYDLHSENIVIEPGYERAHAIDFGNFRAGGSPCVDLSRLEGDLIYRLLPLDASPSALSAFERELAAGSPLVNDTLAGRLVGALRQAASPLIGTPNAMVFWVTGRILHALRFMGGTWTGVVPYSLRERQVAIVESVRSLHACLRALLDGGAIPFQPPPATVTTPTEVGILASLRWLVLQRKNRAAYEVAVRLLVDSPSAWPAEIFLLGAIGGIVSRAPPDSIQALVARARAARRTPFSRGLTELCGAMWSQRHGTVTQVTYRKHETASERLRALGEAGFVAINEDQWARTCMRLGLIDQAQVHFQAAIAAKRALNDRAGLGVSLGGLADLLMATGDYVSAVARYEEDLVIARELGDTAGVAYILCRLGQARMEQLDPIRPLNELQESLECAQRLLPQGVSSSVNTAFSNVALATYFAHWGDAVRASQHETVGRQQFEAISDAQAKLAGVALCEIATGLMLIVCSQPVSACIRLRSGLSELAKIDQLAFLEHALRTAHFCARVGVAVGWLLDLIEERFEGQITSGLHARIVALRSA